MVCLFTIDDEGQMSFHCHDIKKMNYLFFTSKNETCIISIVNCIKFLFLKGIKIRNDVKELILVMNDLIYSKFQKKR